MRVAVDESFLFFFVWFSSRGVWVRFGPELWLGPIAKGQHVGGWLLASWVLCREEDNKGVAITCSIWRKKAGEGLDDGGRGCWHLVVC